MHILLSEDCYSTYNRETALQVWFNVNSSIQALVSGLVAMECAHVASKSQSVSNLVQGDSEEKGLFSFVAGLFYSGGEQMKKANDEKNPKSSEIKSGSKDEFDESQEDIMVKEDKEVGTKVDANICSAIKNDLEIDDDGASTPHPTVGCSVPDATINNVIIVMTKARRILTT